MALLSRTRSGSDVTVFESYIEGMDDYDRFNGILTFKGPGSGGRSSPGFEGTNGNPTSASFTSGEAVTLENNNSLMVTIRGRRTKCCRIRQGNKVGWCPTSWVEYASRGVTLDEDVALRDMNNAIQERMIGGDGICIVVRNRQGHFDLRFDDIRGAETVVRRDFGVRYDPKGDFFLTGSNNQRRAFLSHKAAGGATAYQQYSGVSSAADFNQRKTWGGAISEHPEVISALTDMMQNYDQIQGNRIRYRRYVESDELKRLAIYGPNYGQRPGVNNVHIMAQGDPSLVEVSDREKNRYNDLKHCGILYELRFSDDLSLNGDLSHFDRPNFRPVIAVTYRSDKDVSVNGQTYRRVRAMIAPEILINTGVWI